MKSTIRALSRLFLLLAASFYCVSAATYATSIFFVEPSSLPSYQIDLGKTSVSGLSSGGFMATQFHVAFSKTVMGAGIIAGGPYYCAGALPARSFVETAVTVCKTPLSGSEPDAKLLIERAQGFASKGEIDSLANLKKSKVYLFSGKADTVVTGNVVDQTEAFYRLAGMPQHHIQYIKGSFSILKLEIAVP